MAEYEKKIRKLLAEHGCYLVRHGKGDHDIWHSPINNAILKQSGIDYHF